MNRLRATLGGTMRTSGQVRLRAMMSIDAKSLAGKVAIITGSTSGIGLSAARHMIIDGASVVICSRRKENVDNAVGKLQNEFGPSQVRGVVCHASKKDDRSNLIREAIDAFGGIDILVANAAVNPVQSPILECDEAVWDKIFDVNVKSVYLITKEVLPHLQSRGGGSIVYVSSIGGFCAQAKLGAYSVSKTALFGLTKIVASDLASQNIRVNCVAPGLITTKFGAILTDNEQVREKLFDMISMRRFGHPDEIGPVISFLASPSSSYITGETISVTGGMASRL